MARSLGLSRVPRLDPKDDAEFPSREYIQALVRALDSNFEILNSAFGGAQSSVNSLDHPSLGKFTGTWEDWTPTITQVGNVTKTINRAKYIFFGSLVIVKWHMSITGSGTTNNAIVIGGLPAPLAYSSNNNHVGDGYYFDASAGQVYEGAWAAAGASSVHLFRDGAGNVVGASPNIPATSGDTTSGTLVYEGT